MASNKNGMYFIAGVCNDKSEVIRELKKICPKDYTVKEYECDNILFAKIVYSEYFDDREPYYVSNVVAVSGYNQKEISKACNSYAVYEIQDSDKYHSLINRLYIRCKDKFFFELESKMDFCSVILDKDNKKIVAGVTLRGYDLIDDANSMYDVINKKTKIEDFELQKIKKK